MTFTLNSATTAFLYRFRVPRRVLSLSTAHLRPTVALRSLSSASLRTGPWLEALHEEQDPTKMAEPSATGPVIIDGKVTADTIREELRARVDILRAKHGRVSTRCGTIPQRVACLH